MKKILLILLSVMCYGLLAVAMPAKPGWHTVKQSDGTTLQVQTVGNAFNSAILTRDGLTVARGIDGDYYYISSLTGLTAVRAHEAAQRTAAENAFINVQRNNLKMVVKSHKVPRQGGMLNVGGSNADSDVPAIGSRRIPIILVEFKDKKFNNTREGIIDAMLTGETSVSQYFRDQSNGMYDPQFEVFGIYELSQNREYYGGHQGSNNDKALGAMVTEACQKAAADGVSFKPYDTNSDGYCDVVIVIYAGVGEAQASYEHPEAVWPCHWDLYSAYYYGMGGNGAFRPSNGDPYVNSFAVFNELHGSNDNTMTIDGIGTFAHEFGHCLGLPDFYDTGNGNHYGLGYWDIMCMGCYGNDGFTPTGYSAYEKVFMGWIDYIIPQPGNYYTLPVWNQKNAATDKAVCITSDLNENEYFILENRKKQGWDRYLPGEGIMITHVTYDENRWWGNTPNNQDIQLMTLMNCDNTWSYYNEGTDLWPQGNKNAFTDNSTPAAKLNMRANGSISGSAGYLGKPVTDMVINANGSASFWYMRDAVSEPEVIAVEDVIEFGNVMVGSTATASVGILGDHLTSDVWITMEDIEDSSYFGYSPSTISASDAVNGTELTLTFSPVELGEFMTMIYINSDGAEPASVLLHGYGVIETYAPVMLPPDSAYINLTKFRADWTDQTPAENVSSYTLEVQTKPVIELLEAVDFSDVPDGLSADGGSLVDISDNLAEFLPQGWSCTPSIYAYGGALINSGSIKSRTYNLNGYDKVTVVLNACSYYSSYYGTATAEIMTSMGTQHLTLGNDFENVMIVLDCASSDMVTIQSGDNFMYLKGVEIYAGDLTTAKSSVIKSDETDYRVYPGITDKFYTVYNLIEGGTYRYRVKALYVDETESVWSNWQDVTLFENGHGFELGDVNHDEKLDVTDVTLLIAYVLGTSEEACPICGNVDQSDDGKIDVQDVTTLISLILSRN